MTSEPTLAIRLGSGDNGVVVATRLRVVPVALVLAALHVGLSWWRLARSWWWQDDLNMLAMAADRNVFGLLFSDYNGHLVPGSYLAAWVVDRVSPLSWGLGGGIVLVIVLATDLALLAALVRMFGNRPAILLPYALWCATSLTLTSVVWWAAAMQWMPTCLSLALALWFHVRYVEHPNLRDAAGAVVSVALGLFFFEKALVVPVVLALFTFLYFVEGPLPVRPWRAFRRHVPYWLAHAALAGGYLVLYLNRAKITTGEPAGNGEGAELVRNMLLETYVPGLFGGPLNWLATPATTLAAWSGPPGWLLWASVLVALAVVLGSIVLIRGGWRPWLVLGLFLTFSVGLILQNRLGFVGAFIGRDHRYLTDAALLGVVCIALAWIPLRDGLDRAVPPAPTASARARVRPGRRTRLMQFAEGWSHGHRPQLLVSGAVAIALVTVLGAVSGDRFMRSWETNPAPAYFTNLRNGLALAEPKPAFLFDQEVPPLIMSRNFGEGRMLSRALAVLGEDADLPRFGTSAPEFKIVGDDGQLRTGAVDGQQQTPPDGSQLVCSRPRSPARGVTLTMRLAPPDWIWKAEIAYLANQDTRANVRYGDGEKVPVRLAKGANTIFVEVRGGGPGVSITDLDRGATVCIGAVKVGNAVPAP